MPNTVLFLLSDRAYKLHFDLKEAGVGPDSAALLAHLVERPLPEVAFDLGMSPRQAVLVAGLALQRSPAAQELLDAFALDA